MKDDFSSCSLIDWLDMTVGTRYRHVYRLLARIGAELYPARRGIPSSRSWRIKADVGRHLKVDTTEISSSFFNSAQEWSHGSVKDQKEFPLPLSDFEQITRAFLLPRDFVHNFLTARYTTPHESGDCRKKQVLFQTPRIMTFFKNVAQLTRQRYLISKSHI